MKYENSKSTQRLFYELFVELKILPVLIIFSVLKSNIKKKKT